MLMPVVTVSFSPATFDAIMKVVKRAGYASPSQFLEIAAHNQLTLERDSEAEHRVALPSTAERQIRPGRAHKLHAAIATVAAQPDHPGIDPALLQGVFSRLSLAGLDASSLPEQGVLQVALGHVWGQINRYLPIKIAARWIAVQALQSRQWPLLTTIFSGLNGDVSHLGSMLEAADREQDRPREAMLATGLPRRENTQSGERFMSQVIGRLTRSRRFHPGILCHYGFAALADTAMALTSPGIEFAALSNPVLDNSTDTAQNTLGPEEQRFLLEHIVSNVPTEVSDFRAVLRAVELGNDSPGAVISAIRPHMPQGWTELALRTHVFGLLARMTELGVILKSWEGRRVKYSAGDGARTIAA